MENAIERAIRIVGLTNLARQLEAAGIRHSGPSKSAVAQWKENGVPPEYCPAIERLTSGQVRCEELCPKVDWAYLRAQAP